MKKIATLLLVLLLIGGLFAVTAIESTTAEDLTDKGIAPGAFKEPNYADESMPDDAYGAINPSYRISDSPLLRLPDDMRGWPPVVPPEPREVEEMEDPTAVEIYNIATGEMIRIPSTDTTQQPVEPGLTSTMPYLGLLPPGIVPETVFPPDDRVRITPTTTYPWQTVCRLFITAADGTQWKCSGAIIGCPDGHGYHVLTTGHCIYMHDHGGWATSVMVVPGLDDNYMPYNYAWVTGIRTYTGWTVNQDYRHDWAVLTLDRNVGDYTGWMGRMTADPSNPVYTGILNTAGYPADKDCGTPGSSGLCMYFTWDNGDSADEHNHWYWLDIYGGQSGSPVWVYYPSSGNRYILSVVAYEYLDPTLPNFGTRLNQDKFDRIITWCNEDTPPTDYADLTDDGDLWSGFTPTTVSPSDGFHVWCDVRNVGTASSGGFYVSYYASTDTIITPSDYLIGTDYVPSISPFTYLDSDWTGVFPGSIPAGTYYAGWIIDSENDVTEFDETNNVAYKSSYQLVVNPPCGNMDVNPTSWSPTIFCGNSDSETVTVSATGGIVKGVTVSKVSGPTWLSVSPTNLGDIASGSSKTFTMTASPPAGTSGDFPYTVRVSNTCGSPSSRDVIGTIHVSSKKPDLVISDKWVCWPDNCTICYNVTNIGNGTAPACHNTTLYVDGMEVAHDHVPVDLAPGESYIGCFDPYIWTYTPPSDNITVCADNNETIDELDETNNCLTNIWRCGDVNGDGKVTMSDVRKVFNRYLNPNYPLDIPWAADVNGDGKVTMSDVRKVFNRYLDPGYDLKCCCEGVR
jgi:V8-like Glu-specific endopeptidase